MDQQKVVNEAIVNSLLTWFMEEIISGYKRLGLPGKPADPHVSIADVVYFRNSDLVQVSEGRKWGSSVRRSIVCK